jgi:chromatin assembly factor 1 subunit A
MTHQPRRPDRKTHGKAAFLDELRQALSSLLLSDLGSPVWSCGSETDAWFGNALDQKRIQVQMEKRARIQRFYDAYDGRRPIHRTLSDGRRSRSLEPDLHHRRRRVSDDSAASADPSEKGAAGESECDCQPPFAYKTVFRQLIEVFSRHGNPFVKLKALRDLRALVVASLNSPSENRFPFTPLQTPPSPSPRVRNSGTSRTRNRYSFSEPARRGPDTDGDTDADADGEKNVLLRTPPKSPAAESEAFESRPSDYATPSENQIVDALRGLLLEIKPKTLFRDLQFISAFVPAETLNKTDSGTAFLQFGLAAMSLKEEVCNSMVEIADKIVSQELSRRHHHYHHPHHGPAPQPQQAQDTDEFNARPDRAIEDAAGMWIITAKEGNAVAQRELGILYLTHPELLPRVTLPLTSPRDTFKAEMMYRRDKDSKSDPQSMCLALHWMQLSAAGGDELARNRLREREEFESIA